MGDRKLLNIELGRISPETYKQLPQSGIVLILDNIRSAHNVGSAFRTADAFKADKLWLCGICATPPSAEIHKSALGAEDSVPWEHRADSVALVKELQAEGYTVLCAEQTENAVELQQFRRLPDARYAIVFGNEVDGVQQEVVDAADGSIVIPQFGTKHSLNVSVSVGVVLWEFTSQLLHLQ
ncbi:MAG: RNA methyltransferase [Bacteroidales bacterium]|nr:RNA methyltransferase [Bacteroidales bacterium]